MAFVGAALSPGIVHSGSSDFVEDTIGHLGGRLKAYLDDLRETPPGWIRVYWPDEAIRLLEAGIVEEIGLDHDLGNDERGTGYDVIVWMEEAVALRGFKRRELSSILRTPQHGRE
ncbi:hypothetical protein NK8_82810 (plasmid) [Caballeronia sp. NK8]|nr:hypothetical protein NK8_82810 [Caballeronia sp. NK8]